LLLAALQSVHEVVSALQVKHASRIPLPPCLQQRPVQHMQQQPQVGTLTEESKLLLPVDRFLLGLNRHRTTSSSSEPLVSTPEQSAGGWQQPAN
jgi:hypothetical protein